MQEAANRNSQAVANLYSGRQAAKLAILQYVSARRFFRSRYLAAVSCGLMLASAFPRMGVAGFGWIAPGLILATALGTSGGASFRIGYVAGLVHYLCSLYWLLLIPVTGFPILGWIALSSFLALFTGAWVWWCVWLSGEFGFRQGSNRIGSSPSIPSWSRRCVWAISCAVAWVTWEMVIARIFGGFPWNLLGASQYRILPLIQIASVTGVYGVSFLLVWTSVSLLNAVGTLLRRPGGQSSWIGEVILPGISVAAVFAFGFHELRKETPVGQVLKVGLVQPSIPQTMIWDQDQDAERFAALIRLSEEALANHPDVLIWPEAAVPGYARWDTNLYPAITNLAASHHVWMILGGDDVVRVPESGASKKYLFYNASFLVSPGGEFIQTYRKRNLVIFGEYIPLEDWLPFVKWFTPVTGSFTPGDRPVPFEFTPAARGVPGRENMDLEGRKAAAFPVNASILICFEDNFPHLVRRSVGLDTDFLVNLTNNGWFGEAAAQWQHAANAIFRAVENRRPLVRCTNNGLTCWVDAQGRIREIFRDPAGTIYGPGVLTIELPLPLKSDNSLPFYNRHGDIFGWSCALVAGIQAVVGLVRRRRKD